MRILKLACGLAVLLNALHLGHAVHYFYIHRAAQDIHSAAFMAGMASAVVVCILSFLGGCLLLRASCPL